VKLGIYKIRSRAEFLSLGIIALDQYSTAVGENLSTIYGISVKFCHKLLDSSTKTSVLEQAVHF